MRFSEEQSNFGGLPDAMVPWPRAARGDAAGDRPFGAHDGVDCFLHFRRLDPAPRGVDHLFPVADEVGEAVLVDMNRIAGRDRDLQYEDLPRFAWRGMGPLCCELGFVPIALCHRRATAEQIAGLSRSGRVAALARDVDLGIVYHCANGGRALIGSAGCKYLGRKAFVRPYFGNMRVWRRALHSLPMTVCE